MPSTPISPSELTWSFSSLGCPELSLAETTALAKKFDIQNLELRALSDRLDLPTLFTEEYGSPEALSKWLSDHGVRIVALDSSAKLIGCPPEAKAELLEFAQWATDLNISGIRDFDGGKFNPELRDEDRDEAVEFLKWWEAEKAKNNWTVDLIIETHDALCTARNCLDLAKPLELIGIQLHLLWDAHHTWRKGDEDPLVTWPQIQSMVRHIHVKDSVGIPSARHPFTYTNLGEGEFALKTLIDTLAADGYQGIVSLEWEKKWHPYLLPIDDALEQLKAFR